MLSRLTSALFVIGLAIITGAALACGSQESQAEAPAATADSPQPAAPVTVKVGSKVGQRVPDFSMQLGDKRTVTSEELVSTGRPVFLYFFATW